MAPNIHKWYILEGMIPLELKIYADALLMRMRFADIFPKLADFPIIQ
jgi:hypothetical protein